MAVRGPRQTFRPGLRLAQSPLLRPQLQAVYYASRTQRDLYGDLSGCEIQAEGGNKSAPKRLISLAPKLISGGTSVWNELALFEGVLRQRNSISSGPHGSRLQFIPPCLWKMGGDSSFCQWQSVGLAHCFSCRLPGWGEVQLRDTLVWYSTQLSRKVPGPKVCDSYSPPTACLLPFSETLKMPIFDYGSLELTSHFRCFTLPSNFRWTGLPPFSGDLVEQSHLLRRSPASRQKTMGEVRYGHGHREVTGESGDHRGNNRDKLQGTAFPNPSFSFWRNPWTRAERQRKKKGRWLCECRYLILNCHPFPVLSTSLLKNRIRTHVSLLTFLI